MTGIIKLGDVLLQYVQKITDWYDLQLSCNTFTNRAIISPRTHLDSVATFPLLWYQLARRVPIHTKQIYRSTAYLYWHSSATSTCQGQSCNHLLILNPIYHRQLRLNTWTQFTSKETQRTCRWPKPCLLLGSHCTASWWSQEPSSTRQTHGCKAHLQLHLPISLQATKTDNMPAVTLRLYSKVFWDTQPCIS